jgi:hypothetical protein
VNEGQRKLIRQRRGEAATVFIGFLIGLAYQESVEPVRESIRLHGVAFAPSVLFLVFFFTGLITFLAGYFGLVFSPFDGLGWFLRFLSLVAASVILIFLAGVASVDASREARFGFIDLFLAFNAIALLWDLVDLVWAYRKKQDAEQRLRNVVSTAVSVGWVLVLANIQWGSADRYGTGSIVLLAATGLVTFIATIAVLVHGELV